MAIGALAMWLAISGFWVILYGHEGLLAAMVAVGVFSSVVPYVLEVMILTKIPAGIVCPAQCPLSSNFIVGMIVLRQIPTMGELAGLVLITVAVMLVTSALRKGAARGFDVEGPGRYG